MNQSTHPETEAIRSDIDTTRRQMDDTMDALRERLQPKHLIDEVLGFFRRSTEGNDKLTHLREKVAHSADTAMNAVIDSVKKNPMPALLIGAGVAWMIYESRRRPSRDSHEEDRSGYSRDLERGNVSYDPDEHYDRPLEYPPWTNEFGDQGGSKPGQAKETLAEKAGEATQQIKGKLSHAGDMALEKAQQLKERASELGQRVGERTREVYSQTRDRVVATAEQHPLETGLMCLALGAIAGLAVPTPNVVHRTVGRTADRLRSRTREAGSELIEKGRRVAEAAVGAAKQEAQAQGLTP